MPRINLLPWRDTLRKEREIRFGAITAVSLVFMGLILLSVHLFIGHQIDYQQRRNRYLQTEIEKADNKIKEIKDLKNKKKRLIERMNVIQKLEENRSHVVHLFDELVKKIPSGVYFTRITQNGDKVILEGVAQSDARVSSLMGNIEASQWLTNPKIYSIVAKDKSKKRSVSTFKLEVTQTAPK